MSEIGFLRVGFVLNGLIFLSPANSSDVLFGFVNFFEVVRINDCFLMLL
jgi:hypothetical protein